MQPDTVGNTRTPSTHDIMDAPTIARSGMHQGHSESAGSGPLPEYVASPSSSTDSVLFPPSFLDVGPDEHFSIGRRLEDLVHGKHRSQKTNSSDHSPPSPYRMSSSSSVRTHTKRPSLSNWLTRTSTNSKTPSKAPSPLHISEPKIMRGLDAFENQIRSGTLGSGAIIVGTPQEALDNISGIKLEPSQQSSEEIVSTGSGDDSEFGRKAVLQTAHHTDEADLPCTPESNERPLPTLPAFTRSSPDLSSSSTPRITVRPKPTRAPPPSPPVLRPVLKQASSSSPVRMRPFEEFPLAPTRLSIPAPTPQPKFSPILLSPAAAVDRNKVVVHIETETQTFRTTVNTVISRPSFLASYVNRVLNVGEPKTNDDASSVYSEDASAFHHFLTSEGVLSNSSCCLKIFLDRPSKPYQHILAYLRIPTDCPPSLPRSARLSLKAGLEIDMNDLLDLRDEAVYLGLEELQALCTEELRLGVAEQARKHMRTWSSSESTRLSSNGSAADRVDEGERSQVVITPQSLDKRRSRSLNRNEHYRQGSTSTQHTRDGSGSRTIRRPLHHVRNDSQLSGRWI